MANLQVKGIDDDLYHELTTRAKRNNRSISQEVVNMIQDALQRNPQALESAMDEFLTLCGSWSDLREASEIVRDVRSSRRSSRRFKGDPGVFG